MSFNGFIENQKDRAVREQLDQEKEQESSLNQEEQERVARRSGNISRNPRVISDENTGPGNIEGRTVFDKSERKTIIDTGGFLSDEQRQTAENFSEKFRGGVETVGKKAGELGSKLSPPALINRGIDASPFLPDADVKGASKVGRKTTKGFVEGAGNLFDVPGLVKSADTATRVADDADKLAKNPKKTAGTAAAIGAATASQAVQSAREKPSETFGKFTGSGIVGSAVTPLRVNRFKVPKKSGRDTSVTGLDVQTPPILNAVSSTPPSRKTIGGLEGLRPTTGTPQVRNLDDVDVERLGGDKANQGDVFEPIRGFESDVVSKSVLNQGQDQDVARISSGLGLLDEAETLGDIRKRRVSREDAVETISRARDVESDPEDVARGLERADATIFGSGAVDAQASDGFRQPGDIDIVVPDKDKAGKVIAEETGLTKEQAKNRFDVKEADDFAGLEQGEQFGFGRFSRSPVDAGGIRINPIGEELQRKTGASLFLRGESVGQNRLDIGPRPIPADETVLRRKDPIDAFKIGEELGADSAQDFARAFDISDQEVRDRGFTGDTVTESDADSSGLLDELDVDTDISTSEASEVFDTSSPTLARGDSIGSVSSVTASSSPSLSTQADSPTFDSIASEPSSVVSESPSVSSPIRDSPSSPSVSSTPTSTSPSSPSPQAESSLFSSFDSPEVSSLTSSSPSPNPSSPNLSSLTSSTPVSPQSPTGSSFTSPTPPSSPIGSSFTSIVSDTPSLTSTTTNPPENPLPPENTTNPREPDQEDKEEEERDIFDSFRTQSLTFTQDLAGLDDILDEDDFF